jgi:N-acyl-D-amino-acid deacylase
MHQRLTALFFLFSLPWFLAAEEKNENPEALPITGKAVAELTGFDQLMKTFLKDHELPGASLAVSKAGRLIYARGFGYADLEHHEPVQPHSLMRLASVSKPITAAAVLLLVEQGKLKLTDSIWDLLQDFARDYPGAQRDPRWKKVTVVELLRHTGGWDRDKSFDPMFSSQRILRGLKLSPPPKTSDIITFMMGQPLDFEPGERYAYSNFGYCLLGRVIEKVSGHPYEDFIRRELLAPLGIRDMHTGKTLASQRLPGEVTYYMAKNRLGKSIVGPEIGKKVPVPYGVWYLESLDAVGGWVASAPDLVRFACALDHSGPPGLSARSIKNLFERPPGRAGFKEDGKPREVYYGCGWRVRVVGDGKINTWHAGYYGGTETLLVRRWDGLTFAVLLNSSGGGKLMDELDPLIHKTIDQVKSWP